MRGVSAREVSDTCEGKIVGRMLHQRWDMVFQSRTGVMCADAGLGAVCRQLQARLVPVGCWPLLHPHGKMSNVSLHIA